MRRAVIFSCRGAALTILSPQLHRHLRGKMIFDDIKSDTLNLRVSPSFKVALKAAADHEQRSMVNMLEVLVAHFCESNRITVPSKSACHSKLRSSQHGKDAA